jgi:hypothetical protein
MENFGGEVFSRMLAKADISDWCRNSEVARPCIYDSLEKDTPNRRPVEHKPSPNSVLISNARLGGLHHRYTWRQAA